jgi:uncharacterized RDD family membrane protein YckC
MKEAKQLELFELDEQQDVHKEESHLKVVEDVQATETVEVKVEEKYVLASFPKRAFAFIMDILIIKMIMSAFWGLSKPAFFLIASKYISSDRLNSSQQIFLLLVESALMLWYFSISTYLTGSTPGKFFVNTKVVKDERNKSQELTLRDVLVRHGSYFLSYVIFFVGFLFPLFRKDHKALHDMIAGTRVVNR